LIPIEIIGLALAMVMAGTSTAHRGGKDTPPPEVPAVIIIRGSATWYGTGPGAGHAAAGPALRRALGKDWRGDKVRVCRKGRCVTVRLTDWCKCRGKRIIDLSDEDFRRLAPLSRGVIRVKGKV
jgi:rare lipoprotein A (peptidoglycan hydrolase)